MMKFVVVEDEKNVQEQIRELLRKISVQTEIDIEIEYFSKYNEKLQKEIDNTMYRKIYIMDIESMQVNFDALNVRYQITWSLFDGSEKEAEFIGGYFDGIYSGHRPNDFNYNIMFTIILNFFLEAYKKYKNSNIMEFETYISKCQKLFTKINKLDLNKEFII